MVTAPTDGGKARSRSADSVEVVFDDDRAIANAGLVLPATLARRLGLETLVDEVVDLGERPGAAHPGRKVMTLVHAILAGADSIDDCDLLRAGASARVLGHRVMAPSTLGTFLRSFTFGHVRQLDRLLELALARAWAAGAGPGSGSLVIDVDSTRLRGPRLRQAGHRVQPHPGARVPPAACHPRRQRRGASRAHAPGLCQHDARGRALREGAGRPRAPGRRPR
jgi:hypothetical protein